VVQACILGQFCDVLAKYSSEVKLLKLAGRMEEVNEVHTSWFQRNTQHIIPPLH
jgi:hypothetical protein